MKDSKTVKLIIGIAAAVAAVGAAVAVVIIFKDQIKEILIMIKEWLYTVKNQAADLCNKTFRKVEYTAEECADFADIDETAVTVEVTGEAAE